MIRVQTPTLQILSVDTSNEEDPNGAMVTLKNADRLNALRTRMRASVDVTFEASPVARVMRRDWNLVSRKLYMNARDHLYYKKIESDLVEMCWQMDDVADQIRAMPYQRLDRSWLRPRRMRVDIVHPMTAAWLRSMVKLDEVFALLVCAEKSGMITRRKRQAIMLPCQLAYMVFKATSMKLEFKFEDEMLIESNN